MWQTKQNSLALLPHRFPVSMFVFYSPATFCVVVVEYTLRDVLIIQKHRVGRAINEPTKVAQEKYTERITTNNGSNSRNTVHIAY